MQIFALTGLVLPSPDPAASRRWYAETLGLPADEETEGALAIGDVTVTFGDALALRVIGNDLPAERGLTDPAGTAVQLHEPDFERAREGERHIREFIDGAEGLDGPPVAELVAAVAAVVRGARDELTGLMSGVAHNKVLATQLALSQQAREVPAQTEPDWALHAASTLLSGLVVAGAQQDED
jgi:catechol 2,3-dioxygenase-like lactoylglutathione lyase family enzyme